MKKAYLITAAAFELIAISLSVLSFIYRDNLILLRLPILFGLTGLLIALYYVFIKKPKTSGDKK